MEIRIFDGFWLAVSAILVVAYYIDQHPSAPNLWRSLFRWGKMRTGVVKGSKNFFEMPKRWFQHFYIYSLLVNSSVIFLVCGKVFMKGEWPVYLSSLLELLQYPSVPAGTNSAVPVLLVLVLILAQAARRCYETFFVNVFSPSGTMTLLHYVLALVFYPSVTLSVLIGADFPRLRMPDSVSVVDWILCAAGVVLFLSASAVQHHSFRILAALRASSKDEASKSKATYPLPTGGLFEVVSCPHFLAEVFVYLSYCVVFGFRNSGLLALFVFVLVNQALAALLNHQWYCKNFPVLTKNRRAIFPYVL